MDDSFTVLRDYLYLDVDLARSLYAQLEGGLVEHRSRQRERSQSATGEFEGSVLLAQAKASGDVRWTQSENETQTLHDQLFTLVERRMRAQVVDLTTTDGASTRACQDIGSGSRAGAYLLIKGRIVLKDFRFMQRMIQEFHSLGERIAFLGQGTSVPEGLAKRKAREGAAQFSGGVTKEYAKQIGEMLNWMHGDRLVLQIRPVCKPDAAFETDLVDQWLRSTRETLGFRFGTHPAGDWYIFCQIAGSGKDADALPRVEGLDDLRAGVDTLFQGWRLLLSYARVASPITPVIPIAVYREVTVGDGSTGHAS